MTLRPLALLLLASAAALTAGEPRAVYSPDRRIEVQVPTSAGDRAPEFQIQFQGKPLVSGQWGLSIGGTNLLANAGLRAAQVRTSDSTYTVPFGKSNPVRDHFNELILDVEGGTGPIRRLQIVCRAYDDGVAFRYVVPEQSGLESIEVTDEPAWLRLSGNPQVWPLYRDNYTTSHEGLYAATKLADLALNQLIDLPLLAEYADGVSVAITEANLHNYAGLYLKFGGAAEPRGLRCDLSPLPGQKGVKVRSRLPLVSPWRVIFIGTHPGRFLESNLLLNLNEPGALADTAWLKAGKTTWYWWNGPYQEPVEFTVGLNWETMKHYLDFCARNGIAFHSIMSTPDGYPWYFQSEPGYSPPGADADLTRARAGFPMERVLEYARSQGVGIRLWVHWKPLSEQLEAAFAQYERWGVAGLMVDFLDRDDQDMVRFAEEVLQSAARHHLHIHFHGVWKPTGLQRTYPNLFNHEGVLNLEYLKWSDQCGPEHNVTVPFTRMVAGPMDYHTGGFRSVNPDRFKPQNIQPNVLGTRCHHLAMFVVYENPMPMVCDAPSAYEGQPGLDFLRQVPTTWDETRVLSGRVGEYIVVARRRGAEWYLGAMSNLSARVLEVPLDFLGTGRYEVRVWADAPDTDDPNQVVTSATAKDSRDKVELRLNRGGGQVMRFRPVQP